MVQFLLSMKTVVVLMIFFSSLVSNGFAKEYPCDKSIDCFLKVTQNLIQKTGLIDVFLDVEAARILVALPASTDGNIGRFIYTPSLAGGLGSNAIGLDRGRLGDSRTIVFRQVGQKIVVEQENHVYGANVADSAERRATLLSFASSIIWVGKVIARHPESGQILVDISDFLTTDFLRIRELLKEKSGEGEKGNFSIEGTKSFVSVPNLENSVFPLNVELDSVVTFVADDPGKEVRAVAPDPNSVTLRIHHSFVKPPEAAYTPRVFDPRAGVFDIEFYDFGAKIDQPIRKRLARRFQLKRTDPLQPRSLVNNPIIFYVDPGVPEPIRSALVEGTSWWAEAFEAAGLIDAFDVRILPEDANPLDARYNVIIWVHRQTRGWSNSAAIVDPRTGQVLKGVVRLGSQRIRHDKLIFEGLVGVSEGGTDHSRKLNELALARIRQLAAHEVGHVLGLRHNFAASADGRASVMDYPAPFITVGPDGKLDLSQAYAEGIGEWDKFAIKWLYSEFPPGADELAELNQIVKARIKSGLHYATDCDARNICDESKRPAHPLASVWDNGADPVTELDNVLEVRRIALQNFGTQNLLIGQPLFDLQRVLPPIYLFHRYQVDAVTKSIGGLLYAQRLNGDGEKDPTPVEPSQQRRALESLLLTLEPKMLEIPNRILKLMIPSNTIALAFDPNNDTFDGVTDPVFDQLSAADAAASITIGGLIHPARLARLVELHRRDSNYPDAMEVLNKIDAAVFKNVDTETNSLGEIRRTVQTRFVSELIIRGAEAEVSPAVKTRIRAKLRELRERLANNKEADFIQKEHYLWLASMISKHLDRLANPEKPGINAPKTPPGSPIGAGINGHKESCWHCESY